MVARQCPKEGSAGLEEGPRGGGEALVCWSVYMLRRTPAPVQRRLQETGDPAPVQRCLQETGERWQRPAECRGCASTRWSQLLFSSEICSGMPYVGGAALLKPRYFTSGHLG